MEKSTEANKTQPFIKSDRPEIFCLYPTPQEYTPASLIDRILQNPGPNLIKGTPPSVQGIVVKRLNGCQIRRMRRKETGRRKTTASPSTRIESFK